MDEDGVPLSQIAIRRSGPRISWHTEEEAGPPGDSQQGYQTHDDEYDDQQPGTQPIEEQHEEAHRPGGLVAHPGTRKRGKIFNDVVSVCGVQQGPTSHFPSPMGTGVHKGAQHADMKIELPRPLHSAILQA